MANAIERAQGLVEQLVAVADMARLEAGEIAKSAVVAADTTAAKLRVLLIELADADQDSSDHFARFASERGKKWDEQSSASREDWTRCCERRDAAVRELITIARAVALGQEAA